MALWYGRAGRFTAENGGFRPGQYAPPRTLARSRSPTHGTRCVAEGRAVITPRRALYCMGSPYGWQDMAVQNDVTALV
jgi:hypothetical protein